MSWIRDRLGLKESKSQSNEDKYGIRARLGLSNFASRNQNVDNLSSQRNFAAQKLEESRKKYQDYLQEETKDTRALKASPFSTPVQDLTKQQTPQMVEIAQKQAQALDQAVKSQQAQELKQDIREKQSEYNYANYLKNVQDVENMDVNVGQKILNPVTSAARDLLNLDKLDPESQYYYDKQGNKSYLPTKQSLKQQKIKSETTSKIGKVYDQVVYNISKSAISKGIDLVAPGAGSLMYYGDIFLDSTDEAKQQGFNNAQAIGYATGVTFFAHELDKVIGTMGGLSTGNENALTQGMDKLIFKLTKNKAVSTILSNMGSEAISEFAEEYADNNLKYLINADASDYDSFFDMLGKTFPDAVHAGLIGGISGGVGGVFENISNAEEMRERKQALDDYAETLKELKPQTPLEAEFKENELAKVEEAQREINQREQEVTEQSQEDLTKLSDDELKNLRYQSELFGQDIGDIENELQSRQQPQEAKTEETASKEETTSKVASKEEQKEKSTLEKAKETGLISEERERNIKIQDAHLKTQAERIIKQNNSLEPVEGGLTYKELEQVKKKLTSNYKGKEVIVDGKEAKVKSTQYGKVTVEFKDGTTKTVLKDDIKSNLNAKIDINSLVFNNEKVKDINNEIKQKSKPKTDIKNGEKVIDNIAKNDKEKETLTKMFSEPSKNKTTVTVDDTKIITPSETIRNADEATVEKAIKDTVSESERKQVEKEDKGRRESLQKIYDKLVKEGNEEGAAYAKDQLENNLYDVRHSRYEVFKEKLKMMEDPEDYYKKFREDFNKALEKGDLTVKETQQFQDKIIALTSYFGNYGSKSYNGTIANELNTQFGELGTTPAQILEARRQFYNEHPEYIARKVSHVLKNMYNEQLKKHEGDIAWKQANNPLNENSPYHLNDSQFGFLEKEGNELAKIEDKTSLEYLKKETALNNYIQDLYRDTEYGNKLDSITKKIKGITITNVLASPRIWVQNIKGNFVNMAQFKILDNLPAVLTDKIISSKTGIRTRGISFQGDVVEGSRAFKQGVFDSWYEFKHDVSLSKFASKYTNKKTGSLGDKDFGRTFDNDTKVGKALNDYQRFVNFALTLGDRPFANMYYEQSIYNQRMSNALIAAQKNSKNTIYKDNYEIDNELHKVSYYDQDGMLHSGEVMNDSQYKEFMKTAEVQDITVEMCEIAEKEALENTYQNDNSVTRAALKMKSALNDVFHIGNYGFGDMLLKFTRTGSNMAKALYEHSPLEAITVYKDIKAYNANVKNGTVTPQLQHKLASDIGKLIGGAMTTTIVAALNWSMGIEDDEDKDKIKSFKESTLGSRSYSVKLPGLNYNYKITSDSTIGSLMRLGIDAQQLYDRTGSALDTFFGSATPFMNELIDNSFMESILGLGTSYSDPLDNIARKIASQPANLIPSAAKDLSYAFDGFIDRTTYDKNVGQYMINQIVNRTPLRKHTLSAKKTAWGENKKVGGDILASAWNTFLLGDSLAKVKDDPIAQEVVNIYVATGKTDAMPNLNKPDKTIKYNTEDIELNEKERDKYQTTYGRTAYSAVKKVMNTSQYKNGDEEYRYKLLTEAYDYAKEKATQELIESKGKTFYNATKKDNKYTEYKKTVYEEIVDNDISVEEAQYKRNYSDSYKLKTSITKWDNYNTIVEDIKAIKEQYSTDNGYDYKTRSYAVKTYISRLQNMTPTQKAMLSKLENNKGDYTSYDNSILNYLKTLNLTEDEFKYMYDKLGLGGYWKQYYYTKK